MNAPLAPAPAPLCARLPRVFQDPLLEEPPTAAAPAADLRRYAALATDAAATCRRCPLVIDCLYRAVVEHDVSGYVAGTDARQRLEIRRRLGVDLPADDFDTLAGVLGGSRSVDHDEVLRVRAAHPDETLEVLAVRLGCSLSTVKRHLRRERDNPSPPRRGALKPSRRQVLAAARAVTRSASQGHRRAA